MASIKLEVELEELGNEDLAKAEDNVYQVLATASRAVPSQLIGTVVNVIETDRTEDEEDEEETED